MLVAIEGATRAGKTSACKNVCLLLREKRKLAIDLNEIIRIDQTAVAVRSITHPIRSELLPIEELLLYSVRLARKVYHIKNILSKESEAIILADRFTLSLIAFFVIVRRLPKQLVYNVINAAKKQIEPDVSFLLDVTLSEVKRREAEAGLKRSRKHINLESYFKEYRESFFREIKQQTNKHIILDTAKFKIQEVADSIFQTILELEKPKGG